MINTALEKCLKISDAYLYLYFWTQKEHAYLMDSKFQSLRLKAPKSEAIPEPFGLCVMS